MNSLQAGKTGVILQYSQNHDLYFKMAIKRAERKDHNGAIKYIDMAIDKDSYNAEYLYSKACLLAEMKNTRGSVKLLNYIIWNIDPTYTDCYFGLGCNYFELGNYEKALTYFDKYVMMEEYGDLHQKANDFLSYMGLPEDSEEHSVDIHMYMGEKARKLSWDSSMRLQESGSLHLRRGNVREAIKLFERSIKEYPEAINSRLRLSMAYYMNGELPRAILLAGSALKIQESNYIARLCLALYYSTEGKTDLSESMLSVFTRIRGRKQRGKPEAEDRRFYEQMLKTAPVGDEMKSKLQGAAQRLNKA